MVKKKMAILNLAGALAPEIMQYFAKKGIEIFSPEQNLHLDWTHILTSGQIDFFAISAEYDTIKKNIKLVSISPLDDLQPFVMSNGKLILDDVWFKHGFGEFILDKFFQDFGGIALGDSYPVFKERGSFNITNPFNTGEYLDRLVHTAFLDGMSGLSIKTFFDHLVMYLTGLKNKGKLGLPIEVTYGYFEDVFGIQLHFFTKDLILEDLTLSLSSEISKKAEEYLLNISVHSCDFFDLTFLQEVNKAVVTGLWTKDDSIKIENRGLLISNLSSTSAITHYPSEGVTSYQGTEPVLTDLSEKIVLPGSSPRESFGDKFDVPDNQIDDEDVTQTIGGGPYSNDEQATLVKGTKDLSEDIQRIAGGSSAEKESSTIVKGTQADVDDAATLVKGTREEKESTQTIAGGPASKKEQVSIVKGTKAAPDEVMKISGDSESSDDESLEMIKGAASRTQQALKIKSLNPNNQVDEENQVDATNPIDQNQLIGTKTNPPRKVTSSISPADDKTDSENSIDSRKNQREMANQRQNEMAIEDQELEFEAPAGTLLKDKHLVKGSKEEENAKQVIQQERAKIQEILKIKSLKSEFPAELKNKFNDHLISQDKTLAQATEKDLEEFKKQQIQHAIKNASAPLESRMIGKSSGVPQEVASSGNDRASELKMMALTAENENLKSKMKTLLSEVKILKDSKSQMADFHRKAMETAETITQNQQSAQLDQLLREQMLQKIKSENGLSGPDAKKLVDLMERETQFVQGSKEIEARLKKAQIELNQKETFFTQEIEKLNRQLKAKETVITKSKENVTAMFEKKDQEIFMLNEKLKEANKVAMTNNPQAQQLYVKELEKQVSNHQKMIEIYKEKLSQFPMAKTDDEISKEENRKLQMMNTQFKNQLDIAKKEIQKFQDKMSHDSEQLINLKTEKLKLEESLKKANMAVKKEELASNTPSQLESEVKKLKGLCEFYEVQIKEAQTRNREQDVKLQAALKNQKKDNIADESGKGRLGQLENNVRKLTQDLVESRNQLAEMKKDASKLKLEKVALQNQLDKYKKAEKTDKAKPALPKKPGTGGKAA